MGVAGLAPAMVPRPIRLLVSFASRVLRRREEERDWGHPNPRQGRQPLNPAQKHLLIGLSKLYVFCKDNQAMKKAIVSLVIIGAFVIYSIIHAYSGLVAVVANTPGDSPSSSSSATTTSPIETTVTPNATQTPGSLYRDGSYTGS